MMENDKDIDKATSDWLKKLSPDEPSDSFTRSVMQSVYALEKKELPDNSINYLWFLFAIPVISAGLWYFDLFPGIIQQLSSGWMDIQSFYLSINSGIGDIFGRLKGLSISPIVILIFLAVLSLLVIEDVFSKSRHKLNADV